MLLVVDFSQIDYHELPLLILKNASEQTLGILGYAKNRSLKLNYAAVSTLSFELPEHENGEKVPFYDQVIGMRIIEVPGIGQFIVNNPEESGDSVHRQKTVEAYSLEYEFARKKITLGEGTYRFYDPNDNENSLVAMIMELMPAWHLGTIPDTIKNKYRTFSVENENLYDFMMNTVQEKYGCVFLFDTFQRTVNVRDINTEPNQQPVWISDKNLAKELQITENTEEIFTRLDVNGADDVNIRDVNPDGTNKIVNLDYFMTTDNFDQALIDKYYAWKELYSNNRESYYNLSVRYTLALMQRVTEQANLADLSAEYTNLDNQRAVVIQAIAQGLQVQDDLDDINEQLEDAQNAVDAKQAKIDTISADLTSMMSQLTAIKNACNFRNYFTDAEWLILDRYIKDGDITESTFAAEATGAYMDEGHGNAVTDQAITFEDGTVDEVTDAVGRKIARLRGGVISIPNILEANLISGTVEYYQGKITGSAYLNAGTLGNESFPSGAVTFTGTGNEPTITPNTDGENDGEFSAELTGYVYFTYDVSEYQRRSVAWDLFEYGEETLKALSQPSYSFSVDSANFLALDEFLAFKNALQLGQRIYLERKDGHVIHPILVSAELNLDKPEELNLEFGEKYSNSDPAQKLVELLGQTVSMGKSVEAGKYTYSAFKDSGAATGIKTLMTSALDVSKNQIINTSGQAVSWDGSGVHLRKWTNASQTAYAPEQIWLSNNMIVMTDDTWATAKMAIGKFTDANAGECWGIVAPMVVGTMIAGEQLIIESQKKDGGTAVFRMDEDGCRLYNSDFTVSRIVDVGGVNKTTVISLNPDFGIAIGDGQLYSIDAQTGAKQLDPTHANFWADDSGNLHLTGAIEATSLYINKNGTMEDADDYIEGIAAQFIVDDSHIAAVVGQTYAYLETNGISMSSETISMTGTSSIELSANGNAVTIDQSGVAITGGTTGLSIANSGLIITDNTDPNNPERLVSVMNTGIEMTTGKLVMVADDTDSYIRFGGTPSNPNFQLGLGGDIVAQNGSFKTISVESGEIVMVPEGFLAPKVIVSSNQPTGKNILWFRPNAMSSVDYNKRTSGVTLNNGVPTVVTFDRAGSALAGTSGTYGISFAIYNSSGSSNTGNTVTVEIRPTNTSGAWYTLVNQRSIDHISPGSTIRIDTLLSPTEINANLSTFSQIDVRITFTRHNNTVARLENNTTFILRCENASSAGTQLCDVSYIT